MHVEVSLPSNDPAAVPELARRAEALGFDGVTASEVTSNPFVTLALAAEHTQHIGLATGIALAFVRSPVTMAHAALDLQRLSGGRLLLGLGTQTRWQIERRFGMPWSAPAPRMREYVGVMRAAWQAWQDGSDFRYPGDVFDLDVMTPNHRPPPPGDLPFPPIVLAAVGPLMSRLSGEVAEGIHIHPFGTVAFVQRSVLPNVQRGAERAGRTLGDFDISGGGMIATASTAEALEVAVAETRRSIAYYGHFPEYQHVWATEGWERLGETLQAYAAEGRWEEMPALIDDEVLHRFAAVGTHAEIGERILERFGGYATRVRLPMPEPGDAEQIAPSLRLLREAVASR